MILQYASVFLEMHKMLFWLCPDVKDINCESRKDYVFQLGPWPQSEADLEQSGSLWIFVDLYQHLCRWQIILANMESFDLRMCLNPMCKSINVNSMDCRYG